MTRYCIVINFINYKRNFIPVQGLESIALGLLFLDVKYLFLRKCYNRKHDKTFNKCMQNINFMYVLSIENTHDA